MTDSDRESTYTPPQVDDLGTLEEITGVGVETGAMDGTPLTKT